MAEYIDREDAKRELLEWAVIIQRPRYLLRKDAMCILDNIPAADVAPLRHERWDENGRCTGCGWHALFWCMTSTYYESPYCPNCGAKMDGDYDE